LIVTVFFVLFEILSILFFDRAIQALGNRFRELCWMNAASIALTYLVFCSGVFLLRRLEPTSAWGASQRNAVNYLAMPAACFGFFLLHMAMETGGGYAYLQRTKDYAATDPRLVAAIVGGIALSLVYVFLLILDIRPTIHRGVKYEIIRFSGLFLAQLMIVVVSAYWRRMGSESVAITEVALSGKILIFTAIYVFYLLFVASPRLLLLAIDPSPAALLSFFVGSCYYLWRSLSGTAWA